METSKAIVAILFYQAEPQSIKRLATLLKRTEGEVRDALFALETQLPSIGLSLVQNSDAVALTTAPEAGALIEAITKEELSRDLSKAAQETLAIVLYKGPITRSEIDYIRGVNSTFILRNLLVRGLVEKTENPEDQRSFLYKPTFQLLEFMGVTKTEDLPDYHDAILQLGTFLSVKTAEEKLPTSSTVISETPNENPLDADVPSDSTIVAEVMEHERLVSEVEADLEEENEAGGSFNDDLLLVHTEEDRVAEEESRSTPL